MIANRALGLADYLAIFRRRRLLVLAFVLLAPVAGFLISFAWSPKYTSRSLVFIEEQLVPQGYVKPIVTQNMADRMVALQQQVLRRDRLEQMVSGLSLAQKGTKIDAV